MSRPAIGHRSKEASMLIRDISRRLRDLFGTSSPVCPVSGSGTAALEAAAVNTVRPGGKVLVVVAGAFGKRFADILQRMDAEVVRLEIPWGSPCEPDLLAKELDRHREIQAVFLTHCETSTGVLHPVGELAKAVRQRSDALVIVDGVSSVGGTQLNMDEQGIDVAVTGSQKALMLPPGLAAVAVSRRAWHVIESNPRPRYYLDLLMYRHSLEQETTPFTPPVSLLFGLAESLNMLEEEGLQVVFRRHERLGRMTRRALEALGIRLLTDESCASPTVTAAMGGDRWTADELRAEMRNLGVVIAGGQGQLKGRIFRIGHMGFCHEPDLLAALGTLETALARLGVLREPGAGVKAAQEVWIADVQRVDR
jgi:aspartate aminotransferase-like enzyme